MNDMSMVTEDLNCAGNSMGTINNMGLMATGKLEQVRMLASRVSELRDRLLGEQPTKTEGIAAGQPIESGEVAALRDTISRIGDVLSGIEHDIDDLSRL